MLPGGVSLGRGRGVGRGRQVVSEDQDETDLPDIQFSDSDLSYSTGEELSGEAAGGESNGSSTSPKGVAGSKRVRKGRGRGRTFGQSRRMAEQDFESDSSSDLSTESSLSLEGDLAQLSVTTQMEKSSDESVLSLTLPPVPQPVSEYLPPQQRLAGLFPGQANEGRSCKLQTNHFTVKLDIPAGMIYMYDVNIEPPWKRPYKRSDKKLYHKAVVEWKAKCTSTKNDEHAWVFDGHKQLYSTKKVAGSSFPDMKVTVWCSDEEKEVSLMIKDVECVADIRVTREILEWATSGRSGFIPQDAIHALDVVLKQAVNVNKCFENIGRSYFPTKGETLDVGFGKEVWIGTFTSVRPFGWKSAEVLLTLNVDTANKAATRKLHLTKESAPGKGDSYLQEVLAGGRKKGVINLKHGLTEEQRKTLSKDLEGLKIKYEMKGSGDVVMKRSYRVIELRRKAAKEDLINVDGEKISVEEYYKRQHGVTLQYSSLPCLWVGSRDRTIYLPVEFCSMIAQPLPRRKKLADDAVAKMIKQTAVKPLERQKKIMEGLEMNNAKYKHDPFAKEFGISVSGEMTRLTGRILDPPSIEYKESGKMRNIVNINKANPGAWRQDRNTYLDGRSVENWGLLDLARLDEAQAKSLVQGFVTVGKENGITFSTSVQRVVGSMRDMDQAMANIEENLNKIVNKHKEKNKKLDMVLIVFPFKAGILYDKIKQLGDMKLDITTQCCLKNNLFKAEKLNTQVIANLCLKINAKLGGINHVLAKSCRPKLLAKPVMIMGADVSHPAPESRGSKPSIAAIVGSMEPKAVQYEVQVRVQDTGLDRNEEVIQDIKNVTRILLKKFYDRNAGRKPERIIMFRDGVSEGQFLAVLAKELVAMREACQELEAGYEPPITYLVVQKRHHTRFFPADNNKYRNGNALAGTVVDQGINHPTEGDFYLLSHEGIQGTSRPCHYHVLWDDSNFTADELEKLSYYLCHLYSRCTRSVSYPTPTYYAHLVADRARKHHNELAQFDSGSSSGNSRGDLTDREKIEIKQRVEDGVNKAMYFV